MTGISRNRIVAENIKANPAQRAKQARQRKLRTAAVLAGLPMSALIARPSQAATKYWEPTTTSGTTAGGTWNTTTTNLVWNTDSTGLATRTFFVTGDDAIFTADPSLASGGTSTVTTTALQANSLTFGGNAGVTGGGDTGAIFSFTNGGTLTLGSTAGNTAITMSSGVGAVSFAGGVNINAATGNTTTFTNNSSSLLTFNGTVGANGTGNGVTQTIAITGTGGGVTFGAAIQGNNAALGNLGGVINLSISGGGVVSLNAANVIAGTTTLAAGGSLTLGNTNALQGEALNQTGGTLSFGTLTSARIAGLTGNQNIVLTNVSSAAVNLIDAGFGANNAQAGASSPTFTGGVSGLGGVTFNGVQLTNRSTGGTATLSGNLSMSGGVTVNDAAFSGTAGGTSTVLLSGANTYGGATTLTTGNLQAQDPATNNFIKALSTTQVNLNGGTLQLRANGSGSAQTIITGDGITGNNVVVGANATIDVNQRSANTGGTIQFNNLSIGAQTLSVTGGNTYKLQFAGVTTLSPTGNSTSIFNPTSAPLTLGAVTGSATAGNVNTLDFDGSAAGNTITGVIADGAGGGTLALSKTNSSVLNVTNSNTYSGGTTAVTTVSQGGLTYTGALASGTPFGAGSVTLSTNSGAASNNISNLNITPGAGSSGTVALTGGTVLNSQFSFSGGDYFILNKGSATGVTYTFGNASDASPVLNRVGNGVLLITGPSALGTAEKFIIAGASGAQPVVTDGMVPAYILGSANGGGGAINFLNYGTTNGFVNATTTTTFGANNIVTIASGTVPANSSAYALTTSGAITLAGTLNIGDNGTTPAGLIVGANITGGTIALGASEGIFAVTAANPTISSVISGTNGITKTQYNGTNGSLTLTGLNNYTGTTTVNNGSLTFNNAGAQSFGALNGLGTLVQAGAGTLAFTQAANTAYNIGTITANNGTTGTVTLNAGLNSVTTIGTVNGVSGSTIIFAGDSTGNTTITNLLNTSGQLVDVTSGTVSINTGRNTASNLELDGGTFNVPNAADRLGLTGSVAGQTLLITGGTFNVTTSTYGLRLNSDNGGNGTGVAGNKFTGTQTAGTLNILHGAQYTSFNLGGTSATQTSTYNLSGGTLSAVNNGYIDLGADTAGTSTTTFNFSGGKLLVSSTIEGDQAANAKQAFVWTGGTLAAGTYNAANLTSVSGAAYTGNVGTLTNGGGILAPGDIGTGGKTAITGNYSVTSGAASYAVDLGSTTVATAFQSGAAFYDQTAVSGNAALGGTLSVGLINSFTPTGANTFTILTTAAAGRSGTFTNTNTTGTAAVPRIVLADGLSSMTVTYGTANVVLGGYLATNTYSAASGNAWDAASAVDWTAYDPGSTSAPATVASGAIAQFADGAATGSGANTVTLNSTRNIQGIQFSSAVSGHNYTINNAGSGSIILDNTGNSAAATIADSSASGNSNAINVPITLKSNLNASVANAANGLTIGAAVGESTVGSTLTKTGNGTLILTAANSYTGGSTVTGGTLSGTGSSPFGTGTVNVNSGGAIAVNDGGSTGESATTGGQTWAGGGGYTARVANASVSDTMSLTLGTTPTLTLTSTTGSPFTVTASAPAASLDPTQNDTWQIASFQTLAGNVSAPGAGNSTVLATAGAGASSAGFILTLPPSLFTGSAYGSGGAPLLELEEVSGSSFSLDVVYNATPEPGTAMLVLAGGLPMLAARRRRRQRTTC